MRGVYCTPTLRLRPPVARFWCWCCWWTCTPPPRQRTAEESRAQLNSPGQLGGLSNHNARVLRPASSSRAPKNLLSARVQVLSQCTATVPPLPPRRSSLDLHQLSPTVLCDPSGHDDGDTLSAASAIICSTPSTQSLHLLRNCRRDDPPTYFLLHDKLARPHDHLVTPSTPLQQRQTQTRPRTRSPSTRRPGL